MKKKTKRKIFKYIYTTSAIIFLLLGIYRYAKEYWLKDKLILGPYYVEYVIDGDTFVTNIDNKTQKIRVIGIDTPESAASEESNAVNTPEGTIATKRAKELLEHKFIYLEYGEDKYDGYGRILAYVYLEDKKTLYETVILSEGLSKLLIFEPNTKYSKEFNDSLNKAKLNNVGFWKTGFFK